MANYVGKSVSKLYLGFVMVKLMAKFKEPFKSLVESKCFSKSSLNCVCSQKGVINMTDERHVSLLYVSHGLEP
jgi:hypothetical protein